MRLGLKIFVIMFMVAFTVSGATGAYFYYQAREAMLESIQSQLITAAKSFSGLISGDELENLKRPEDMDTSSYRRIQSILYHIAQTNDDFLSAYTMRLQDDLVLFVVDSPSMGNSPGRDIPGHEAPEPVGAQYLEPPPALLKGFVRPSVDDRTYQDQWGWTISGYAPIKDFRGRNVGLLGIDMCADHVESKLAAIKRAGILSLVLAGLLALGFSTVLSRHLSRPVKDLHKGFQQVSAGDLDVQVQKRGNDELAELSEQFNLMVRELREKQLLKTGLGKVMHKKAVSRLLSKDPELGGEMVTAGILFCDLRGFTRISEKLPPKMLVQLLNDYFSSMVKVVEKHGGMVDKFVGDKIMAVFSHHDEDSLSLSSALQAGMEMLQECDSLNTRLGMTSDLYLENSIGLHAGRVLAGNIGSPERMEYTVIGDAVNTAARLEGKTRELGTRLVISAHAAGKIDQLPDNLHHQGKVSLEGRREKLEVYALDSAGKTTASPD